MGKNELPPSCVGIVKIGNEWRPQYKSLGISFPIAFEFSHHAIRAGAQIAATVNWPEYVAAVIADRLDEKTETRCRRALISVATAWDGHYLGDSNTQCLDHQKIALSQRAAEIEDAVETVL